MPWKGSKNHSNNRVPPWDGSSTAFEIPANPMDRFRRSKKQAQQVLEADFPSPSFFYPVPSCKKFTPSFTWCWNILKHGHFGVMCWNVLKHGKSFPWSPMLKHDLPGVNLLYRSIQRAQSSRSRGWVWRLAESEAPDVDFLAVVTVTLISDHFEH